MNPLHWISCREATELHSRHLDESLGTKHWIQLKSHLVICPRCSRTARSMDLLRLAMRSVAHGDDPHGTRLDEKSPERP